MDTVEPTVPLAPPPPGPATAGGHGGVDEPPPGRVRWSPRRRWATGLVVVALLGAIAAGLFWKLPYFLLSPGSVRDTEAYIHIDGAPSYPDEQGVIDYLTVSVRQATPFELVGAWIDPAVEVVEEKVVLGDQTPSQNRQLNLQLMADSKDSATYQALRRLGYEIPTSGTGAVIASVDPAVPAAAVLTQGDVVVAADGEPVAINQDLIDTVTSHQPGDTLALVVQPLHGGETRPATVQLASRPDDPTVAMLGVSTFTRDLTFDFPVDVTIDSGRVGGPSAGLAFTLGVLDAMTPESLTGGARIATTGTMRLDGTVGPVGGVHQKVVAARRAGVDLMLVPTLEVEEARRHAGDLRVEPVDDLADALDVLATLGGGDLVLPPEPTSRLPG
jgi:PDZ domain-containing protein